MQKGRRRKNNALESDEAQSASSVTAKIKIGFLTV